MSEPAAVAAPQYRAGPTLLTRSAAAIAGGALYSLGYVGWGVWPCLFVFLVPLWWALAAEPAPSLRASLLIGLAFGGAAYAGGHLWLWSLVDPFFDGRRLLGAALWSIYGLWFALAFVVYAALFRAVMDAGDLELVRWLHEKGVPVDDGDVSQRTPLSFAADYGKLPIVQYLLQNGADIDARDVQQRTPLAHAAGSGHPNVIAFLADHGADVNVRDQFGDTPLIVACAKGNAQAATILLRRGADEMLKDQAGRTAKERSAPDVAPCRSLPQ